MSTCAFRIEFIAWENANAGKIAYVFPPQLIDYITSCRENGKGNSVTFLCTWQHYVAIYNLVLLLLFSFAFNPTWNMHLMAGSVHGSYLMIQRKSMSIKIDEQKKSLSFIATGAIKPQKQNTPFHNVCTSQSPLLANSHFNIGLFSSHL